MRESMIEQTALPNTFTTPVATRAATAAIRRDLKVFPNPNKPYAGFSKPSDWINRTVTLYRTPPAIYCEPRVRYLHS